MIYHARIFTKGNIAHLGQFSSANHSVECIGARSLKTARERVVQKETF